MASLSVSLLLAFLFLHGVSAQEGLPPWQAPSPSPNAGAAHSPGPEAVPGMVPSLGVAPAHTFNDSEAPVPAPASGSDVLEAPGPAPIRGMGALHRPPPPPRHMGTQPVHSPMAPRPPAKQPMQAPMAHGPTAHTPMAQRPSTQPTKKTAPTPQGSISSVKPKTPSSEPGIQTSSISSPPPESPIPGTLPQTTFQLNKDERMDCCLWTRDCARIKAECTRETLRDCANGAGGSLCDPCQLCRDERSRIPHKNLILAESPSKAPVAGCFKGEGDTVYELCERVVYQCHVYTDIEGNCPPHLAELLL